METRREERIGQLLQELKRSDKLHLKDAAAILASTGRWICSVDCWQV